MSAGLWGRGDWHYWERGRPVIRDLIGTNY